MINLFKWDDITRQIRLDDVEILLVKEFAALMSLERNKTKSDPTGIYKERAFKEFTYMYQMLNFKSAYADYSEQERHKAALEDSFLTEEEYNDLEFRAACRKYKALQESSKSLQLIKAATGIADKLIIYFKHIDLDERDLITGKPIYKAKDIISEVSSVSKVLEELKILEFQYKKEAEAPKAFRAGAREGFDPEKIRKVTDG